MNPRDGEFKRMFKSKNHKVPKEIEILVEALAWASTSQSAIIAVVRFQKRRALAKQALVEHKAAKETE